MPFTSEYSAPVVRKLEEIERSGRARAIIDRSIAGAALLVAVTSLVISLLR